MTMNKIDARTAKFIRQLTPKQRTLIAGMKRFDRKKGFEVWMLSKDLSTMGEKKLMSIIEIIEGTSD